MKLLFGLLLVVGGLMLGVYLGLYVCFIGGIVDIINEVKAPMTDAGNVAWAIAKIVFAGAVGWSSFLVVSSAGALLISASDK